MTEHQNVKQSGWPPLPQIVLVLLVIGGLFWYSPKAGSSRFSASSQNLPSPVTVSVDNGEVIPLKGVKLPVQLGNLGPQLVATGVIDKEKFLGLYTGNTTLTKEAERLLTASNGEFVITQENSPVVLNLLWALGLGNKNPILDSGEMTDPRYGGAGNFASTGGWTIAKGNAMEHYSKHGFIALTPEQQALVDKVSRNIYRPCCGNSVHFPDCNHGMAMLGFLELMASQGASEKDMYKAALAVNSYWFPDTYITIAAYMKSKGTEWRNVEPQIVLGAEYSSGQGFARIASQVTQSSHNGGGGGCGVGSSQATPLGFSRTKYRQENLGGGQAPTPRQQGGCGVGEQTSVPQKQSGCGV